MTLETTLALLQTAAAESEEESEVSFQLRCLFEYYCLCLCTKQHVTSKKAAVFIFNGVRTWHLVLKTGVLASLLVVYSSYADSIGESCFFMINMLNTFPTNVVNSVEGILMQLFLPSMLWGYTGSLVMLEWEGMKSLTGSQGAVLVSGLLGLSPV